MPSVGLRISSFFDLQPGAPVVFVNAEFPLRHDPLEVAGADLGEEGPPVLLDVLRVKQPRTLRGPDESREPLLSLDKGPLTQLIPPLPAHRLRLSFTGSEDGEARTATCRAAKPLWRKGPLPYADLGVGEERVGG